MIIEEKIADIGATTVNNVFVVNLPRINDPRGNLSFIEELKHIPFKIERTYWVYDVPGGEKRGCHAYWRSCEFVVALSGSFDLTIHDGCCEQKFSLNRSYYGLYVPQMLWRCMDNFSTNSLALVLSSTVYNETDYIRDFHSFLIEKERWMEREQACMTAR